MSFSIIKLIEVFMAQKETDFCPKFCYELKKTCKVTILVSSCNTVVLFNMQWEGLPDYKQVLLCTAVVQNLLQKSGQLKREFSTAPRGLIPQLILPIFVQQPRRPASSPDNLTPIAQVVLNVAFIVLFKPPVSDTQGLPKPDPTLSSTPPKPSILENTPG